MTNDPSLAVNGGPQCKTVPYGTTQRFGEEELRYLRAAIEANTLFYGYGNQVKEACRKMGEYTGRPHIVACSSGTAAVHLGLIACGIGPGDEVITTPNTDSGTVIGIIEEGAVPVFCDCNEEMQPTAATIAARITERTKAVVVVHLAGYAAPIDEISDLCQSRGIGIVEDCAQSWGTRLNGRLVGTWGTAGAYSTNDFKHISTGDGGFVALNDETLYRRVFNYADKHYDRFFDLTQRQAHHGLNYRMSELQGAVAIAQLDKVNAITDSFHAVGKRFEAKLQNLKGGRMARPLPNSHATYWWSVILPDWTKLNGTRDGLVKALQAEGIAVSSYGGYDLIQTGLFRNGIVRPWLDEPRNRYPFVQPDGRRYTYDYNPVPTHKRLIETAIRLSINGAYSEQDVDETASAIHKVFNAFAKY